MRPGESKFELAVFVAAMHAAASRRGAVAAAAARPTSPLEEDVEGDFVYNNQLAFASARRLGASAKQASDAVQLLEPVHRAAAVATFGGGFAPQPMPQICAGFASQPMLLPQARRPRPHFSRSSPRLTTRRRVAGAGAGGAQSAEGAAPASHFSRRSPSPHSASQAPLKFPKPRGRAPLNEEGDPATWDGDKGEWVGVAAKTAPKTARRPRPTSRAVRHRTINESSRRRRCGARDMWYGARVPILVPFAVVHQCVCRRRRGARGKLRHCARVPLLAPLAIVPQRVAGGWKVPQAAGTSADE